MVGTTILQYEIIEELGHGGMGAVYKAQDTKLDRFVALKFLPADQIATEENKARFIQEAKAASALNHPNVCTIHDIQEDDGQLFLVMEYIDGVTLRDNSQNLTEKKILDIGTQVAEGLAAAHEKGIVHRDIKPENIMIRKDGIAQIMDFGLAKLHEKAGVSRLTKAGTTMGTLGYMSPEQVQGLETDHRTDIFSFGVVMYELLAGEAPFKGMHETAIMYEIVNVTPPPISAVKEGIDPHLEEIILECLEKDKNERCQSAKELARNLRKLKKGSSGSRSSRAFSVNTESIQTQAPQAQTTRTSTSIAIEVFNRRFELRKVFGAGFLSWILVLVFMLSTLYLAVFNKTTTETHEIKAAVLPPQGISFVNDIGSNITISPNGKYIAFVGRDSSDAMKLWLRPVNSLTARALTDASVEAYPFWSPDSRYIAYFNSGKLMKISLEAGTSLPICDAQSGRGGSWSKNGIIVLAPNATGGLYRVPSAGGDPKLLVQADTTNKNHSLRWPFFLPDGKHFLYSTESSSSGSTSEDGIFISSIKGEEGKMITKTPSNAQYANGHLFYVGQSILLAQKFDPGSLKLSGEEIPLAENLQYYDIRVSGSFSVSDYGTIIYQDQSQNSEKAVLLNRKGNIEKVLFDKNVFRNAQLSPDGNKIVFASYDATEKNFDIWTYDMNRNVSTRLTFEPTTDIGPVWTPNGKQIAYSSNPDRGVYDMFIMNSDGSGQSQLLSKSENNKFLPNFSSDGKYILCTEVRFDNPDSKFDIVLLPQSGDKTAEKFVATNFSEGDASFSPNMKWVAYASDESGKDQVYIVPFANSRGKWQISIDGGSTPKWMDNGKSVYFFTSDNKIMGVDINETESSLSPDQPYLVFKPGNMNISEIYDIDKTGTKILATIPTGESIQAPITLVANWQQEIEGKK
jgi:serine/threonine protein kinase